MSPLDATNVSFIMGFIVFLSSGWDTASQYSCHKTQGARSQERGDEELHKTEDFTYKWGIQQTEEHTELLLHMTFNNRQETWGRIYYE